MSTDVPHILAFDTSSPITSLAICAGPNVLAEQHLQSDNRHAEVLLPRVKTALGQAGIGLAELDVIGVGVGPGSFTGVRVGVATAKGLGLSLGKPVIPVVSLDALAHEAVPLSAAPRIAVCLDAFKGELFAAVYARRDGWAEPVVAAFCAAPERVRSDLVAASGGEPLALAGAGVARYPELLADAPADWQVHRGLSAARASAVAQLALTRYARGDVPALTQVAPLYLRGSDAQLPKHPLRV